MRPRTQPRILIVLVAFVLSWARFSHADIHPVAIEKDTDAAKCTSCHEDKTKGKVVHSAMSLGCLTCHEVRVNKDVTRVKLIATSPVSVCITCHADKDAATIKGTVHRPAVRDCLKCHDPHSSDNKFMLLKPTSGDAKENLCLTCHQKGLDVPEKGSRHAALDMGCTSCHVMHKTGPNPELQFRYHLVKTAPELCVDCHDLKDATIAKAHQNQPFEKANCLSCHDPHQSSQPKLLQAYAHPPFAEKQCEICHEPAKDGKVVLTAASAKEVCVTCHSEQAEHIQKAKVQHPGAAGECTDCHNPHAGKTPGLPKEDAISTCLTCHADQAEEAKKHYLHEPAFQQGCATCHEPHGGDRQKLLRANGSALCIECHGPDAQPKKLDGQHLVAIFDGQVRLPEGYFGKVPILPLKQGMGHPTPFHPVSDTIDPKTKANIQIDCFTCHQPHASAHHGLLAKDQEANTAFCKTCHKEGTKQLQ